MTTTTRPRITDIRASEISVGDTVMTTSKYDQSHYIYNVDVVILPDSDNDFPQGSVFIEDVQASQYVLLDKDDWLVKIY